MGILDYVSDLYATLSIQEAHAEEPQNEGEEFPLPQEQDPSMLLRESAHDKAPVGY